MKLTSMTIAGESRSLKNLNLFVGKNNSGKSTLLKELYATSRSVLDRSSGNKWVESLEAEVPNVKTQIDSLFERPEELRNVGGLNSEEALAVLKPKNVCRVTSAGRVFHGNSLESITGAKIYTDDSDLICTITETGIEKCNGEPPDYRVNNLSAVLTTVSLAGEFCDSRLSESFTTLIQNLERVYRNPSDIISRLFCDRNSLGIVNARLKSVFGFEVGFDTIRQAEAPLRIMPTESVPDSIDIDPVDLSKWWDARSPLVANQGDGLKAFLKVLMTLLDPTIEIVFIDEPETFLHPPQRRAMGEAIVDAAKGGKQLFVATHDADVIRGILTKPDCEPCVFNLNNENGFRTVSEIDLYDLTNCTAQTKRTAKHGAQMLNERVLNALFYEKTVLVENENDRMIYELFAQQRLYDEMQGRCFIGLNGNDTVLKLFDLMTDVGMSVCCIIDLDFLLADNSSAAVNRENPSLRQRHSSFKATVHGRKDYEDIKSSIKEEGVDAFKDEQLKMESNAIIQGYSEHGIFIVPSGELESWFSIESPSGKNNIGNMVNMIQDESYRFVELTSFLERVMSL